MYLSKQFGQVGIVIACAFAHAITSSAQIPTLQLSAVVPAVGQAASTVSVRAVEGESLDQVDQLIFSHPGIVASLKTGPARLLETEPQQQFGHFDVRISPDVAPGIYEVRSRGRHGVSNPRAFLVTQSPVQVVDQEHTSVATAVDLSLQQIMVDRVYPQRRNFYKSALSEGQRIYVCGHSRRLDSRSVIAVALLDPSGREVARSRAVGEFPAEIVHHVTKAGEYTLLVYDFLYQGGDEYGCVIQAVVDPPGTATAPACELRDLCAVSVSSVYKNQIASGGRMKPSVADPAAVASQWLASRAATDVTNEQERAVPFTEVGEFPGNAPSKLFDFKANAGQILWVEVNSSKLDQLTDPRVIVYKVNRDAGGKETLQQLAEQDDAAPIGGAAMKLRMRDPYLQFTAPENATYRILLADNQTGVRPSGSRSFVLTVREAQPGFELLAYQPFPSKDVVQSKHWGSNLMRGGTEAVHVLVTRRDGFADAIELSVEGLPAGVVCDKVLVPAGANDATLVFKAAEDAADAVAEVKIKGRSIAAAPQEREAMAATILRGVSPTRNTIESRLAANLVVRVNAQDTAPLVVTLGDGQTVEMSRGGKLNFPIRVVRRPGGAGKCTLRPQNLPPKMTLGETAIEGDKAEGNAELTVVPDSPLGEITFWMQNETVVKWRPNPQALSAAEAYAAKLKTAAEDPAQAAQKPMIEEALKGANERVEQLKKGTAERDVTAYLPSTPLRIRILETPFRVLPVEAVSVTAGTEQQVALKLERLFGFADAVSLSLASKPPIEGLEVVAAEVVAGMDSAMLNLKIPANAVAGSVNVPIKLECKFNTHTLSQVVNVPVTVVAK